MSLQSSCSDIRQLVTQIEELEYAHPPDMSQGFYSPHTRTARAEALFVFLNQSQRAPELFDALSQKTRESRDDIRIKRAAAANSVCPALQLPDEILRLVFLLHDPEDDGPLPAARACWMQVYRVWRSTTLGYSRI
ncbi:hypothetical protein DL93DRAFT_2089343 [Clavulina sp. PMI_390]|nr:hypothetical protein DL93DRAFT_2089343 [Clavulina sp. PMI_390]